MARSFSLEGPVLSHEPRVGCGQVSWQKRWLAPGYDENPTICSRHGPELCPGHPRAAPKLPPRCPHSGQKRRRRDGGALSRHFVLHDQIRTLHVCRRVVEQAMQDGSRVAERQASDDPEWTCGHPEAYEVGLHHEYLPRHRSADGLPQPFRPDRIHLDRDHLSTRMCEGKGQCADSGTDFDYELAGTNAGVAYELFSPPLTKEILTETAASLVSFVSACRAATENRHCTHADFLSHSARKSQRP